MTNAKIQTFLKSTIIPNKLWHFVGKKLTPRNVEEKDKTSCNHKAYFCV